MNIGILGAGHIARALAEGWSRPGLASRPHLSFYDVVPQRADELAAVAGGEAAPSAAELVAGADLILVAVRPQHVQGVLEDVAAGIGERMVISVAAGITLARLVGALPAGTHVARVMPNGAAALGLGVFMLVPGTLTAQEQEEVTLVLSQAGTVLVLEEEQFDVATAVAGCMPGLLAAYVAHFAEAAESRGIAAVDARILAIKGVHGAAALIARKGDPAAVIAAAATPGGMTAAGIEALEALGLGKAVDGAVQAAAQRAKELA